MEGGRACTSLAAVGELSSSLGVELQLSGGAAPRVPPVAQWVIRLVNAACEHASRQSEAKAPLGEHLGKPGSSSPTLPGRAPVLAG